MPHEGIATGFIVEEKGSPGLIRQVHGADLVEVRDATDALRLRQAPPPADAVYTRAHGVRLSVVTADCVPVLLHGRDPRAPIAAVHCGWRGARLGIVASTLRQLGEPSAFRAVLGPCILACCFEVREDFLAAFRQLHRPIDGFVRSRAGKTYCDLLRYVVEVELAGVPAAQIDTTAVRCTYCSSPELPSYRRTGGTTSRLRSWIERRARGI
jgi:YfiH family protein